MPCSKKNSLYKRGEKRREEERRGVMAMPCARKKSLYERGETMRDMLSLCIWKRYPKLQFTPLRVVKLTCCRHQDSTLAETKSNSELSCPQIYASREQW